MTKQLKNISLKGYRVFLSFGAALTSLRIVLRPSSPFLPFLPCRTPLLMLWPLLCHAPFRSPAAAPFLSVRTPAMGPEQQVRARAAVGPKRQVGRGLRPRASLAFRKGGWDLESLALPLPMWLDWNTWAHSLNNMKSWHFSSASVYARHCSVFYVYLLK